jgi:uncharacterized membrane protein YkvI
VANHESPAAVSWFKRYVLPGFVLKSVIIGGGYATGREFAEFFLSAGPAAAIFGVLISALLFSLVYAATLEFARLHHTFEYRGFFRLLLGRAWIAFEILYLVMLLLVLAVLSATVDALLVESLHMPAGLGAALFAVLVATLAYFGTTWLERYLVVWSFVLYGFYISFVTLCVLRFGHQAADTLQTAQLDAPGAAAFNGLRYAGYNISAMTATLFCVRHLRSRKDALVGGLLGGPLAMLPGALFVFASLAFYPDIVAAPVPMHFLLARLNVPVFHTLFLLVVLTALIGTGAAMIHAVNERLAASGWHWLGMPPRLARAANAVVLIIVSATVAARAGLVALVAQGYGLITYGFILLFMVPVLTVGVWRIMRPAARSAGSPG